MTTIVKYPRTHHIEGSRKQPGDEDMDSVPLADIEGEFTVIEEKLDGANAAVSFDDAGELKLQSRGHFLTGGYRERHFNLLKTWANAHRGALESILGRRYIAYGEWLYAKHTVFYDRLPHYFLEFDVLDRETRAFLSTARRRELFAGSPVSSVPVLFEGQITARDQLEGLVAPSLYKSATWRERLRQVSEGESLDPERVALQTDPSEEMEGLYIKVEREGRVVGRYKFVRASFLDSVAKAQGHWLDRPIVPNQLAPGVSIFEVPS